MCGDALGGLSHEPKTPPSPHSRPPMTPPTHPPPLLPAPPPCSYVLMNLLGKGGVSEVFTVCVCGGGGEGDVVGGEIRDQSHCDDLRGAGARGPGRGRGPGGGGEEHTHAHAHTHPHTHMRTHTCALTHTHARTCTQAYDLAEARHVCVKIHALTPGWSAVKKESYVRHAIREYDIHRRWGRGEEVGAERVGRSVGGGVCVCWSAGEGGGIAVHVENGVRGRGCKYQPKLNQTSGAQAGTLVHSCPKETRTH